jgi:cytochrome c-type biogenesis protein CcmE
MTPVSRNRLLAVGAICVAGAALAVISYGNIGQNLVYYWSPAEMLAAGQKAYGPTVRLGGVVKAGSIDWNAEHTKLKFRVAENASPEAPSVEVICDEVPPQMFREGIGVVVEGTLEKGTVFKTNRLMVNHSNEYRPPKPGDSPEKWKKSLAEGAT